MRCSLLRSFIQRIWHRSNDPFWAVPVGIRVIFYHRFRCVAPRDDLFVSTFKSLRGNCVFGLYLKVSDRCMNLMTESYTFVGFRCRR